MVALTTSCARSGVVQDPSNDRVQVRSVWLGALDGAHISPDGSLVAFVDWGTGNLGLRDLLTGTHRPGTGKGSWAQNGSWVEYPLFSPDGDWVAYAFANVLEGDPYRYELRRVSSADTAQEVLFGRTGRLGLAPMDWHPEAGILYLASEAEGAWTLRTFDFGTKVPQTWVHQESGLPEPSSAVFAPGGQFAVFATGGRLWRSVPGTESPEQFGVPADEILGWLPDGSSPVIHARVEEQFGIWAVRSEGARGSVLSQLAPAGPAVLAAGTSREGVHYLEPSSLPQLFALTVPERGETPAAARVITGAADGIAGNPTWSSDGSRLAFTLRHPTKDLIRIRTMEMGTGATRTLSEVPFFRITSLRWNRSGNLVAAGRHRVFSQSRIISLDAVTDDRQVLLEAAALALDVGPGGEIAFVRAAAEGERIVDVRWVEPGVGVPLVLATYPTSEAPRSLSVSPNGEWVALMKPMEAWSASVLVLLRTDGGESRTVLTMSPPRSLDWGQRSIPWTEDGRHVVVSVAESGRSEFYKVAVADGTLEPLGTGPGTDGRSPALRPDGRELVHVGGSPEFDLKVLVWDGERP